MNFESLDSVIFYDKPFLKFERLLETYHAFTPKGLVSFLSAIPVWIKEKLFTKKLIYDELAKVGKSKPRLFFSEHHLSHAASAFYPSPFKDAAILTLDGVGEWATTTMGYGSGNSIKILKELDFPHSIGLLYSSFTDYCGFRVNSGEYKLMGLAPYGNPNGENVAEFKNKIMKHMVDIRPDGSILLNMKYFWFATGLQMCHEKEWRKLFGFSKRQKESEITQIYMDLALAIQQVTEDIILKMAVFAKKITGCTKLVMAGGVALNCVANGKLFRSGIFDDIWIQPAAGDAGGALGAAYCGWYIFRGEKRENISKLDKMQGVYLGPEFSDIDIGKVVRKYNAPYNSVVLKNNLILAELE